MSDYMETAVRASPGDMSPRVKKRRVCRIPPPEPYFAHISIRGSPTDEHLKNEVFAILRQAYGKDIPIRDCPTYSGLTYVCEVDITPEQAKELESEKYSKVIKSVW